MSLVRLSIFARYPEPGRAKTRLIPALGERGAAAVCRRLLEHTIMAARQSGLPFELRVTGASGERFTTECGEDLLVQDQGGGDLGDRLARVNGPALVIGSDLPALTSDLLRQAAGALRARAVVLGPASDGGYWLVGFRERLPWLFTDMPWSTPCVLPETLSRLARRRLIPAMLPELSDVDEPGDLADWPELLE